MVEAAGDLPGGSVEGLRGLVEIEAGGLVEAAGAVEGLRIEAGASGGLVEAGGPGG